MTRIEVTIAAPVDTVWAALRDKDTIRHWHGWEFDGLDAEIDLIYFTHFTEDAAARTLSVQEGDEIRLEPVDGGTKVTLTRAPRGVSADWDAYYDEITEGWTTFLNQLRFAVEVRPGEPRRTIFLQGEGKDDLTGAILASELRQGTPEVFYRAANQTGYLWDGGLLVVARSMVIVSVYGLSDAEFAGLTDRWRAWWLEHVGPLPE